VDLGEDIAVTHSSYVSVGKRAGSVVINLLIAIFGTTVIENPISSLIKVHTLAGILQREYVLNAICGCLLGYFVYRRWQLTAAKWLWTVGVGWIALRAILLLPAEHTSVLFPTEHKSIWSALSGSGCSNAVSCTNELVLTILALRIATYSVGAIFCSRLQHNGPSAIVDAWFGRFRPLKVERTHDRSGDELDR
jgi:hypothetical protein